MEKVKIAFDKDKFEEYGAWMLFPDQLAERYGKIDFETIKFFLEGGDEFIPEGGGPEKFINVTHIYKDKDTFVEFDEADFIPDPWIIKHQVIFVEFELDT